MSVRRYAPWIGLVAALGGATPARGQGVLWTADTGGSVGVPAGIASDAQFHPASPTVYVVQGNTLRAFDASASGMGAPRWSGATYTFANVVQNFPNPVPLRNGTIAVFVGGLSGYLYAINATTRQDLYPPVNLQRAACASDQIVATPAVQLRAYANDDFKAAQADDLVMVVTRYGCSTTSDNQVIALHASDGTIAWRFDPAAQYSSPMDYGSDGCAIDYASNTLYCGTHRESTLSQNTLWAIDTTNGKLRWKRNAGAIHNRPQIRANRLLVGTFNGILSARDIANGLEKWAYTVTDTGNIVSNVWPEFRNNSTAVYVADTTGAITRIDETTDSFGVVGRTFKWKYSSSGLVTTLAAVDPVSGYAWVGAQDTTVRQIYLGDGKLTGSFAVGAAMSGRIYDPSLDIEGVSAAPNRLFAASTSKLGLFSIPWADGISHTVPPPKCPKTGCDICAGQQCVPDDFGGGSHCEVVGSTLPDGSACSDTMGTCSCDSSKLVGGACPTGPGNFDACRAGACVANVFWNCACNKAGDPACCPGTTCCGTTGGGCVDVLTSAKSCGGCGNACPSGYTCSGGDCVWSACTPNCTGKTCGPDGCGGTCGSCCGTTPVCGAAGTCQCSGASCGAGGTCIGGTCCIPSCIGRTCGSDGCGGSCGTCSGATPVCNVDHCECNGTSCGGGQVCTSGGGCCTPFCQPGAQCGSDGCGGLCGTCDAAHPYCDFSGGMGGRCKCTDTSCPSTTPYCNTANNTCQCSSTSCGAGNVCLGTSCCTPNCTGRNCGSDGCGGSCGSCSDIGPNAFCSGGNCSCTPTCPSGCHEEDLPDGCGGSCPGWFCQCGCGATRCITRCFP